MNIFKNVAYILSSDSAFSWFGDAKILSSGLTTKDSPSEKLDFTVKKLDNFLCALARCNSTER